MLNVGHSTRRVAFRAMVIAPMTTPGITDRYTADKIFGFPAGGVTLMPMSRIRGD